MNLAALVLIAITLISCSANKTTSDRDDKTSFIIHLRDAGLSRGVTVAQTYDGGYILTGYTTDGEHGGEDVFLIKTNAKGETTWRKTFGGEGKDNGWAVRQIDDGGYIIAGFSNSFGDGDMDVLLIRTDSTGKEIWDRNFRRQGR